MSVTEKASAEAHARPKVEPALNLNFLSHGTLECREIEWSRKFYEEFLGLEVVQTSAISLLIRLVSDHVVAVVKSKKVHEMNLLNHNGLDVRTKEEVDAAHRIVTEKRAMAMSPGLNPPTGFSKRKILGSKHGFVTMKSLVDGTAAPAERAMVLGIFTAMGSFFLIFVGLALIGAKTNPVLLGVMVIPTLWLWNIVKDAWRAYRRVKAGLPEDEEDVQ